MAKRSRRGDRDRRQALNAGRPRLGIAGIAGIAGLLAAAGTALFVAGRLRPAAPLRLPSTSNQNVLLITIDTLRGDALGCYGRTARTPNIDALAAAGVRFTFAHAHSVVTLPSHASMLTGTYPFQHGLRENSGYRLAPGLPTLATLLKAQGFATGAFVGAFPLDGPGAARDVVVAIGAAALAVISVARIRRPRYRISMPPPSSSCTTTVLPAGAWPLWRSS